MSVKPMEAQTGLECGRNVCLCYEPRAAECARCGVPWSAHRKSGRLRRDRGKHSGHEWINATALCRGTGEGAPACQMLGSDSRQL